MNNFIIKDTVRIEELLAFFLLYDKLPDKQMIIGDDGFEFLPDISAADKSFGVEVAVCERKHVYRIINKRYIGRLKTYNFSLSQLLDPILKSKASYFKLSKNSLDRRYSFKKTRVIFSNRNREMIFEQFRTIIHKKLKNLNNGNYDAVNRKYLFIVSNFEYKNIDIKDFVDVYQEISKEYDLNFDGLLMVINNKLYNLLDNNLILKENVEGHKISQSIHSANFDF